MKTSVATKRNREAIKITNQLALNVPYQKFVISTSKNADFKTKI